ncbi:pyridoxal phosphate-dependent aminotransferase [Chroococcus sp. FPU101]|uniref:pyridoxal phosphate-dependent aminotransferase n=1 Tax=Chroococcus sp. FPU101 TaxID=1974212 RepID=UPI001A8E450F|nr:pyridoxal phosphate-dependent aminotransferase [Chroococcus sp. FPU101]GFE68733.1 aminotransferase class I and II [Chroococcus sp. FPU101]
MNSYLSRMEDVQSPIIPVVGQLIRENVGTISLGQGVVSYSPPVESIETLSAFLADAENHKYKAVYGIPTLLTAIEEKLQEDNHIHLTKQRIIVTAGGNMAYMNAILAITSVGDEIILNTPYYFNHEMAIMMAGCHPVLVKTDENYQPRPDAIEAAITEKTRAVVTISPNNPTGVVYSESLIREVNEICQRKGIYHINDEVYEYFTYDGIKHFSPGSISGSQDYTISLYSLSKAYGFASWRIGYMIIPEHLFVAINKIQDTIVICPPVISQYAALGALKAGKAYCQGHLEKIALVRKIVLESLQSIQDLCTITPADGAFYFFLKVNRDLDDFWLVKTLIEKHKIAVLPGSTFGMTDGCYLRLAYGSLPPETAAEGMERFVKGLRDILS